MRLNKILLLAITLILLLCGLSIKPKALSSNIPQSEGYILTFNKSTSNGTIMNSQSLSINWFNNELSIVDNEESSTRTINITKNYVSIFYEYYLYNYNIVILESNYFTQTEQDTTELYRYNYRTQSHLDDMVLNLSPNMVGIIYLGGDIEDRVEYIREKLRITYRSTDSILNSINYNKGYNTGYDIGFDDGSNINLEDYVEKNNVMSWITGFISTLGGFFAIKFGSVSLGAIVLIPVAISLVWFILRLFRGGGSN